MKVGTLVRWTHDDDSPVGIVLVVERLPDQYDDGRCTIFWSPTSDHSSGHIGIYPAQHRLMEIVNETR